MDGVSFVDLAPRLPYRECNPGRRDERRHDARDEGNADGGQGRMPDPASRFGRHILGLPLRSSRGSAKVASAVVERVGQICAHRLQPTAMPRVRARGNVSTVRRGRRARTLLPADGCSCFGGHGTLLRGCGGIRPDAVVHADMFGHRDGGRGRDARTIMCLNIRGPRADVCRRMEAVLSGKVRTAMRSFTFVTPGAALAARSACSRSAQDCTVPCRVNHALSGPTIGVSCAIVSALPDRQRRVRAEIGLIVAGIEPA